MLLYFYLRIKHSNRLIINVVFLLVEISPYVHFITIRERKMKLHIRDHQMEMGKQKI